MLSKYESKKYYQFRMSSKLKFVRIGKGGPVEQTTKKNQVDRRFLIFLCIRPLQRT